MTPVLLAWSGGKDSCLALRELRRTPGIRVEALLTTITREFDRISMHGVRRELLERQAASLGLPLRRVFISPDASNDLYDAAWARAISRARDAIGPVENIAYGDLFLEDVRKFREEQSVRLDYLPLFPLWGLDTRALARAFVDAGYDAYLTCVDTQQLDASFAGRRYDARLLDELPAWVDPCGERGEFHTCVVGGPIFSEAIPVTVGERTRRAERFQVLRSGAGWCLNMKAVRRPTGLVLACVAAMSHAPAGPPTAVDLLDRYDRGDRDAVIEVFKGATDAVSIRNDIEKNGAAWAAAAGPAREPHRWLVATTMALELANSRMHDKWLKLRELVEWGCQLLRRGPPTEGERLWQRASIAVAEGALDSEVLFNLESSLRTYSHASHAQRRFAAERALPLSPASPSSLRHSWDRRRCGRGTRSGSTSPRGRSTRRRSIPPPGG